jgi:hypothetical protein
VRRIAPPYQTGVSSKPAFLTLREGLLLGRESWLVNFRCWPAPAGHSTGSLQADYNGSNAANLTKYSAAAVTRRFGCIAMSDSEDI